MMAEPASFIASWLTPSSLFIIVNLVIGTIAITSRFGSAPKNQPSPSILQRVRSFNLTHYTHYEPQCTQPQLVSTPSFLDRVTSFHKPQSEVPELVRAPSLLDRLASFHKHQPAHVETQHVQPEFQSGPEPEPERPELVRSPSLLQRLRSMNLSRLYKSESMHREPEDSDTDLGKAEMRKSASEKEWEVERRRPATATATARVEATLGREDEEVDVKADDFINRFKKQLRLQRIDSLIRYREMLSGGNS